MCSTFAYDFHDKPHRKWVVHPLLAAVAAECCAFLVASLLALVKLLKLHLKTKTTRCEAEYSKTKKGVRAINLNRFEIILG